MSAGQIVIPSKAKLNIFNGFGLLDGTKTYNITLHTSAWTPDPSTLEVFADVTGELPTGNGYTQGGLTIPGGVRFFLGNTGGRNPDPVAYVAYGINPLVGGGPLYWTASGGAIPAWRYGVIRAVGIYDGKVDPVLGYMLGDSTGIDVPATLDGSNVGFGNSTQLNANTGDYRGQLIGFSG